MTRTTFCKGPPSCRGKVRGERSWKTSWETLQFFQQELAVAWPGGRRTRSANNLKVNWSGALGCGGVRVTTDPAKIQQEAWDLEKLGWSQLST